MPSPVTSDGDGDSSEHWEGRRASGSYSVDDEYSDGYRLMHSYYHYYYYY